MKLLQYFTIVLLASFTCRMGHSQNTHQAGYAPRDAKGVVGAPKAVIKINLLTLRQKMKWDDFLKLKMFEELYKKIPEQSKKFLNDPSSAGINLNEGFYVVISGGGKKGAPALFGRLNDTARFASAMRTFNPQKRISSVGGVKILINKNTAIGWNNENFVLTGYDSTAQPAGKNMKSGISNELAKTKQLTERCRSLLEKRTTLMSKPEMTSFMAQNHDVLIWIDNTAQSGPQNNKMAEALGMLNKSLIRKGNYSSISVDFENGRLAGETTQYVSMSLDSLYSKYPVRNINTEPLKRLPPGHPIFLFAFNFSPPMLKDLYEKAGTDKLVDSISKHKVELDDILGGIRGDVMLAVMKLDSVSDEDSATRGMGGIQVFVTGGINDKEKFKNLAALLQPKASDSSGAKPSKKSKPLLVSNDSAFAISLSKFQAERLLQSTDNNRETQALVDPYKNNPSVAIFDLRTIFGFLMQSMTKNKSEEEARQTSEVLGTFDKLIAYGGQHQNHSITSHFELTLSNKDENSLQQFLNLINLFYSMKAKKSVAYIEPR